MKRAIIVHGFKGKPDTNWKPWLKAELETVGMVVDIPEMPSTDSPVAKEWVRKLDNIVGVPSEEVYLIGHSLGCITILRYLEGLKDYQKIGGCVLVAGFGGRFRGYNGGHDTFFDHELNWFHVKSRCDKFIAIHSKDDPNVDSGQLSIFKEKLGAKTILVDGMGHFGSADGVFEVPLVRDEIVALANNMLQ